MAREVRDLLRERIALYKVPKIIEFLPDLPKTSTGKIRRNVLRERSLNEEAGEHRYEF